jgi:transcriptional antiterminator NusG
MTYQIGDHVGFVDLMEGVALEVPISSRPKRWHILQVFPGREAKVWRALDRRGISAYLPIEVRARNRKTGAVARRKHLGHVIKSPFIPGLIFIPDFELENSQLREIDDVEGLLYVGPCLAFLTLAQLDHLRALEALSNMPRGQRKYALGQMVRITDGPFFGFEGRIDRLDSRGRLKLFLDALKRGASVVISEAQIEPADPATHDLMV